MSNKGLENLKFLFKDSPDVLRLLDLRELDLAGLEADALIREQKNRKIFREPVNFYATGRTGAGKTSLGNRLLDTGGKPMVSHGYQDCTNSVQYFQLTSNLRYFDLPGAGSNENYENINRAALLIEQLEDDDEDIIPVTEFSIFDFSNHSNKGAVEREITVEEWESNKNQKDFSPDIILYVIAPHMQFLRPDRSYLRALLKSLKEHRSNNKVIFALNIHSKEGQPIPTPQNIEDVRTKVAEIYQKYYPGDTPLIAEIDSLKGTGFSRVADFMCRILPQNKIGNMKEVLRDELKESAKRERSRRYRQTLIYIASRLATYRVDVQIGKGVVEEAYAAVCDYGIRIFKEEDTSLEASRELYKIIDSFAAQAKISREEAIKITISDVEEREVTENEIVGYTPEYEDVEVPEQYIDYEEEKSGEKTATGATMAGTAGALLGTMLLGPIGTILGSALGAGLGGAAGASAGEKKAVVKDRTRIERRLVGVKEEREDVTKKIPYVVQRQKEVGTKYLQGGYPVVENLLAIGLGIESADLSQDLRNCFEDIVKAGQDQVRTMLSRYQDEINKLAESSDTPEKAKQAEKEIIKILEQTVMN